MIVGHGHMVPLALKQMEDRQVESPRRLLLISSWKNTHFLAS